MQRRTFQSMGTQVELAVSHSEIDKRQRVDELNELLEATQKLILDLENKLSRFIEDNELNRLNYSQGSWFRVSDDLAAVLRRAESAFIRSNGVFNPYLGTTIARLGYMKSFDEMKTSIASPLSDEASENPLGGLHNDTEKVSVLTSGSPLDWSEYYENMVKLLPGHQIDLGGIAKGWIVEQAAEYLKDSGVNNFVVDAGGDMVCSGSDGGAPWTIGIENPVLSGNALVLDVKSASIATSGTYKRKWQINGKDVHHIIDPVLSWSANTDIVSSSVLHSSLTEAEWIAKTALIKGSELGMKWLREQTTMGFVVVLKNGEVRHAWM